MQKTDMKAVTLGVCVWMVGSQWSVASEAQATAPKEVPSPAASPTKEEQEVLSLSKDKWRWMSERNVEALEALFHDKAVFVHMGGTMSRSQELDVIRSGRIQYKHAEILEASVSLLGTTAIVLNRIRLVAVVGGNEVTNPFVVTEVYVQEGGTRKLASLSFTRLLTP
jgi:Domain of unknown function (DUF4440)